MALGNVTVNAIDLQQGPFPTVEKYFLFIGSCTENQDVILRLDASSDLDALLGVGDSVLKSQVSAARVNAGPGWAAAVVPKANGANWNFSVDQAMAENIMIEAVVLCDPIAAAADLDTMQAKAIEILAEYGRRIFFIAGAVGLTGTQIWPDYFSAMEVLTDGVAADRVSIVPYIFDDAVGIYAGRLCSSLVSVADSPMRVATGPIVGRSESALPVDDDGYLYTNAHAKQLNDYRFSVPAMHSDLPGVYWSDGQTLDDVTGDFSIIENLRVVDKAARAVRVVLIGLLGNRSFNSTPVSETWAKELLERPVREMSFSTVFNGIPFPAEVRKPKDGDIVINWITNEQVEVFLQVTPFSIPKQITASIMLDRSVQG